VCDQARLALAPALPAAAAARRFAAAQCDRWELDALHEDTVLTLSELVTNAVVHAATPITVTMSLVGTYLEVAVSDDSPRAPILRPARVDLDADIKALIDRDPHDSSEATPPKGLHIGPAGSIAGGRGMLIVDALADEWGVAARSGGKEVWFRLRTPAAPRIADCTCPSSSVLTPGGLPLHV
jgi:anti-sigma regulatory factor (Ser/Thr protein kinase)